MSRGTHPIRLLLVEPDPLAADLMRQTLEGRFGLGSVAPVGSLAQTAGVDPSEIDLVLSDMILPDGDGLELIGRLLALRPDLPVVLVARESNVEAAIAALHRGAYDYLVKAGDFVQALPLTVEKNLAIWRMRQENLSLQQELSRTLDEVRDKNQQLEQAVRQLAEMAATDPLTGLANRRALAEAFARGFAEAQRHGRDLSCVMIDLDGFKQVNDALGHQRGDDLLVAAGRVLQEHSRRSDVVGRYGGDEFVLLLPGADHATAAQVARRVASEFRTAAANLFPGEPAAANLTMSLGLASLNVSRPTNADQLLAHADHALYRAKQLGRSRLEFYDPPTHPHAPSTPAALPAVPALHREGL